MPSLPDLETLRPVGPDIDTLRPVATGPDISTLRPFVRNEDFGLSAIQSAAQSPPSDQPTTPYSDEVPRSGEERAARNFYNQAALTGKLPIVPDSVDLTKPVIPLPRITGQIVRDAMEVATAYQYGTQETLGESPTTKPGRVEQIIAGSVNAINTATESLTTPQNLAILPLAGEAALAKPIAAYFYTEMLRGVPEAARHAGEMSVTGTPEQKAEAYVGLGVHMGMAAMAGSHAARPAVPKSVELAKALDASDLKAPIETGTVPIPREAGPLRPGDVFESELPNVSPELQSLAPQTAAVVTRATELPKVEPVIEEPPLSISSTSLEAEKVQVPAKLTPPDAKRTTEPAKPEDGGANRTDLVGLNEPLTAETPPGPEAVLPDRPAPPAATKPIAKAQAEVTKVAKEEGQRSAKDIKEELITEIEQRLMKAPAEAKAGDTVTIEIPDDGTFTVPNNVEALSGLLVRAKKIKTDAGKAPGVPRASIKSSSKAIAATTSIKEPVVPEHLRPSQSTQAILDSQPATQPPEGGFKTAPKPAPEGGAILGIGGRRTPPPSPVGNTPRGDRNWLRIPSALRRVGRGLFTEGARAVLGRTRNQVGQELSNATRRHVDVEQELFGMHEAMLRTAVRAVPRQRLDAAMTEASQYFREVENGRPAPALSPEAQSLIDAWFRIGRSTGDIARANNVMVFDPAIGAHRPMGNVANYVPRMFNAQVEAVLRDPQSDPVLFNRLAQEIATHRGITLEEGAAELRGVAGRFQSNDYMANLELARGAQMPELFYEYNLRNLAARYLPSYSERMAQIIAYGQRLGPRDAPQRMNLWDVARRESEDSYTQQWLNAAEDQATGFKPKSELEKNARRMQALASATLLSDPTTTVPRNLLSGLSATTEVYGVGRSVRQFGASMRTAARLGAREIGSIRDDLASFLNSDQLGDSALDNAIRGTSEFTLKASGFTGSENFVRTHNAMVASSFARDAASALARNPASRLSREALAQFQRWNIDPEAIIREGGNWRTGPVTRQYIRTAVREMQGGYRFDQVPLWANSTSGRFFYQYGRWGVQRALNIFENIVRPAIGEDVQFRGQRMVHRDALPMIRTAALLIGLGETFGAISAGLFGRDRRDSSLSEIGETWSEDEMKAVGLLGERMVNDIIMAGTLGIIGQPLDFAKAAKDQSRFKNPLDPPSAAGIKAFIGLAQKAVDQDGTLTKKDLLEAASGIARGPKNVTDVARHHLGESLYEGQNDQRTLRNAAVRWAKEAKEDVPIRSAKTIRKSPTSPVYESVNDALLAGDAEKAERVANEFIDAQKDQKKARTAVKASVRARQPFRAGNMTSDSHRNEFMEWAEKNLSAADLEQINRVQERYETTAEEAGLK